MNLINPKELSHLSADIKLTSNGDNAKTAKVVITARSGDAIEIPGFGMVVHDFSGMSSKSRIPLDVNHDMHDSIGYLNNFDTTSGDLVCSGAIVIVDDEPNEFNVSGLVQKMLAGVPYEASIQTDDEMTLQFIPEGTNVQVNDRNLTGPLTIVTDWNLKAVAICKFGADSDTSADIQLSKNKIDEKGYFLRIANNKVGINLMSKQEDKKVTAVETEAEVKPVEAKVEAPKVTAVEKVEATPVAVEAKTEEVKEVEVKEAPTELSKVDVREEFKRFVTAFGKKKAAGYFADGLNFTDALTKFSSAIKAENEDLKQRLSAVDRGAETPVRFSKVDSEAAKGDRSAKPNVGKGLASLIKLPGK